MVARGVGVVAAESAEAVMAAMTAEAMSAVGFQAGQARAEAATVEVAVEMATE
jgi:hypothetical protein